MDWFLTSFKSTLFDMEFDDFSFASPTYIHALELQEQMKQIAIEKVEIAEEVEKINEIVREAVEQDFIRAEISDQVEEIQRIAQKEIKENAKIVDT